VPPKKIDTMRRYMAAGDWRSALKLASTFPRLGDEAVTIRRAWEACARPDFYRSIRRDPAAHVAAGIKALRRRYPG
jgi:hypothetical protein